MGMETVDVGDGCCGTAGTAELGGLESEPSDWFAPSRTEQRSARVHTLPAVVRLSHGRDKEKNHRAPAQPATRVPIRARVI
jgi:hypothetical protein